MVEVGEIGWPRVRFQQCHLKILAERQADCFASSSDRLSRRSNTISSVFSHQEWDFPICVGDIRERPGAH